MILVATSAWVAHPKTPGGHPGLIEALEQGTATTHPFVDGELLLSGAPVGVLLAGIDMLQLAPHREAVDFLAGRSRPIRGIGWVDAHLVYSALLHGQHLLTLDRRQAEFYRDCAG